MMRRSLILSAVLALSGCSFDGMKPQSSGSTLQAGPTYDPSALTQALRSAANLFAKRVPTPAEFDTVSKEGLKGYEKVIQAYMAEANFAKAMVDEHKTYFELPGPNPKTIAGVNFNEPANIAGYVVTQDLPYTEIVTASYCVDDTLTKTPFCNSFTTQAQADANAAGIMTTRGLIAKWKPEAGFNFHLVGTTFEKLLCTKYPDADDEGLPKESLSTTKKTFQSENQGTALPNCYSCHRTINSKATLFYSYNMMGLFTTNLAQSTWTDEDNVFSAPGDLLVAGTQPRVWGANVNTVKDYGQLITKEDRFARCTVQHFVNYAMGKKADTQLPPDYEYLIETFVGKDEDPKPYNVKRLLLEISKSSFFINRL